MFNSKPSKKKIWLVVSTPLKIIGQSGLSFPIYGNTTMWPTTNQTCNFPACYVSFPIRVLLVQSHAVSACFCLASVPSGTRQGVGTCATHPPTEENSQRWSNWRSSSKELCLNITNKMPAKQKPASFIHVQWISNEST